MLYILYINFMVHLKRTRLSLNGNITTLKQSMRVTFDFSIWLVLTLLKMKKLNYYRALLRC